jgi:predicted cation transporter
MVLIAALAFVASPAEATGYLDSRNFTEPMFVFVIMVIAGTRAILQLSATLVSTAARVLPLPKGMATYFLLLALVPLLGSFITEPAAMTLAALMLRDTLFSRDVSSRLKYATVGVLFVNISIGGTLTPFAAPPVLMVAATWNWDFAFMLSTFGWRAAIAVAFNAAVVTLLFRRELQRIEAPAASAAGDASHVPASVILVHLVFLALVVVFAHYPPVFMGLFLFFMGFTTAYQQYQDRLILREALLVAFFLAGLVVLGGMQQWWLEPVLMSMDANAVFFGATALTAITDNAALTYLGSLVPGLSDEFKVALVAGAVTGGGLTVIANAPNPAGQSILNRFFPEGIAPGGLLLSALGPTIVMGLCFMLL